MSSKALKEACWWASFVSPHRAVTERNAASLRQSARRALSRLRPVRLRPWRLSRC